MSAVSASKTAAPERARQLNALARTVAEALVEYLHEGIHARGFPDITPAHGRSVLAWVDEDGARPGEIARASRLTRAAVAERIAEITKMGYIETVPIPNDGRGKLVVLTEKGRAMRAAYDQGYGDLDTVLEKVLGQDRYGDFRGMLEEIADELAPGWRDDRLGR